MMDTTQLSGFIGDSNSFQIPLTWAGTAFSPANTWALIFTAKYRATDIDDDAVFQKATNAGITLSGPSTAVVATVPNDTAELPACVLVWDIQAQHVITGAVRTVAIGRLSLTRDVTRETTTSIPVVTTEDPLPYGPPMPTGLEDLTSVTITADDELELVKDGITYYTPLFRRA